MLVRPGAAAFMLFYLAQKVLVMQSNRTRDTDSSVDLKTASTAMAARKPMDQVLGYGDMAGEGGWREHALHPRLIHYTPQSGRG